jgi:hypothetical protein
MPDCATLRPGPEFPSRLSFSSPKQRKNLPKPAPLDLSELRKEKKTNSQPPANALNESVTRKLATGTIDPKLAYALNHGMMSEPVSNAVCKHLFVIPVPLTLKPLFGIIFLLEA